MVQPRSSIAALQEGNTFIDVGCGDGYFSLMAAKKTGAKGRVYAVDIDGSRVEMLKDKAERGTGKHRCRRRQS